MLADALGLSDDEQWAILACAMSESNLDFASLIRETMDDLAGTPLPPEVLDWHKPW